MKTQNISLKVKEKYIDIADNKTKIIRQVEPLPNAIYNEKHIYEYNIT